MRVIIISFLFFFASESFCQNYPHLFDLQGLEDNQDNTHLFYRFNGAGGCWQKDIYHLDLNNNIDTLFIPDFGYTTYPGSSCEGDYINDNEFFNNDPSQFFYCGYHLWIDPVALLRRYDGDIQIPAFALTELEMSSFNENLVYVSGSSLLFKSTDGGYNFTMNYDSLALINDAMISLSKNDDSQIYGIDDNKLVRSEDEGYSYTIVDDNQFGNWNSERELFYDADGQHIYYIVNSNSESTLRISDSNGNPNSWNIVVNLPSNMAFTFDEENTGEIYYSFGKWIYKSTDYGVSFFLYKVLDQKVTGLYKKSGSNILYASTPLKIYEITPDTILTIKSLPIPEYVFDWFPLNFGDKWIYKYAAYGIDSLRWYSIVEVVGYKSIEDRVYNEVLVTEIPIDSLSPSGAHYQYFRVDSSNGLLYQAWIENDSLRYEELYMDLIAEVGDTIPVHNGIVLVSEVPFSIFGLDSRKRTYDHNSMPEFHIELVNGLGLVFQYELAYVGYQRLLKGCVIDGELYGDTITVSVDDQISSQPIEFSLSQNYPNPFNPTTKIKFTIPSDDKRKTLNVTLKVYDVLGKEAVTLVSEVKPAGKYEVEFNGTGLPSGIYFYQLKAGSFIQTRKMILLK